MSAKNAKTLMVVHYHGNPSLAFLSKAGVSASPRGADLGRLIRRATAGAWLYFPAMTIFGGLSADQVDQILTRMRQP